MTIVSVEAGCTVERKETERRGFTFTHSVQKYDKLSQNYRGERVIWKALKVVPKNAYKVAYIEITKVLLSMGSRVWNHCLLLWLPLGSEGCGWIHHKQRQSWKFS